MISNSSIGAIVLGFVILLVCIFLVSCKTSDKIPKDYDKRMLYFGGGGGFTGQSYEFCLLENGSLFNINESNEEHTYKMKLKKKQSQEIFKKVDQLTLLNLDYNEPGNMYKFIKVEKATTDPIKLVWGNPTMTVDPSLNSLYAELISLTQTSEKN